MERRTRHTLPLDADGALSRRRFVTGTVLMGAGVALAPLLRTAGADQQPTGPQSPPRSQKGSTMSTRTLGTLEVSALGAGAMSISANYGPPADKSQGITLLREAHQRGVTFFDTAEVYGPYTSEALVGDCRGKVALVTGASAGVGLAARTANAESGAAVVRETADQRSPTGLSDSDNSSSR